MPAALFKTLLFISLLMAMVTPAQAHKINMFAFAEGDDVFVEGYFTDGKKPKNSPVQVYDADGNVIVEGQTDEEGTFQFALPDSGPIRITLNAGQGHLAEYELSATELGLGDEKNGATSSAVTTKPADSTTTDIPQAEIEALVRKAVGQALRPVMRSLSELKEQRGFSDIVGGIGIIMGIGGIFLYVKARKMLAQAKGDRPDA